MPDDHARFWAKVDRADGEGCWLWVGTLSRGGYGEFSIGPVRVRAHRWAYEQRFGAIPGGLQIDHLCRVRHCVRPDHMEPITSRENTLRGEGVTAQNARKTHCPQGHPLSGANLYIRPSTGHRLCRTCRRVGNLRAYYRRKARNAG